MPVQIEHEGEKKTFYTQDELDGHLIKETQSLPSPKRKS